VEFTCDASIPTPLHRTDYSCRTGASEAYKTGGRSSPTQTDLPLLHTYLCHLPNCYWQVVKSYLSKVHHGPLSGRDLYPHITSSLPAACELLTFAKLFRPPPVYVEPVRSSVSFGAITLRGTPLIVNIISTSQGVPPVILDWWARTAARFQSRFCCFRAAERQLVQQTQTHFRPVSSQSYTNYHSP
jgi:hypothetical protein